MYPNLNGNLQQSLYVLWHNYLKYILFNGCLWPCLVFPKILYFVLSLSRSQANINRGGYERGKTHRGGVGPRKCFQHAFVLRARSLPDILHNESEFVHPSKSWNGHLWPSRSQNSLVELAGAWRILKSQRIISFFAEFVLYFIITVVQHCYVFFTDSVFLCAYCSYISTNFLFELFD